MNYKKSKIELTMSLITNLSSHHNSNFYTFCQEDWHSWTKVNSKILSIILSTHLQLLERQVYSVARLWPDHSFLSQCQRLHLAGLCMLCKVNSNSNHCLFSTLPSASTRVRQPEFVNPSASTRVAAAAHPLEFKVSRCKMSQFPMHFSSRPWFECGMTFLHCTLRQNVRCVQREQSIVGCFPELSFLRFSMVQVLVGLRK